MRIILLYIEYHYITNIIIEKHFEYHCNLQSFRNLGTTTLLTSYIGKLVLFIYAKIGVVY